MKGYEVMKKAVIIGVGPVDGLGAALAEKFSKNGLEVFISGRTQSKLDKVSDYLCEKKYKEGVSQKSKNNKGPPLFIRTPRVGE